MMLRPMTRKTIASGANRNHGYANNKIDTRGDNKFVSSTT
jgi:hypothetical protein